MLNHYTPGAPWYWVVDNSKTQVYFNISDAYISVSDTQYKAWLNSGNMPTPIDGNGLTLLRIDVLENIITDRMIYEAIANSDTVFPSASQFSGLTAKQVIAQIVTQKAALRSQISS